MITGLFGLFTLLVAWRWELVGGGLMFLGTSVNAYITKMQEEPWGFYIGWMLAFLFLTSGSLRIAVNPAASRRAIKTARTLALAFALLALASLGGCFGLGAYKKFNG
jgi:peptidoglycan/LPS O-acetylase OafA/YrhL